MSKIFAIAWKDALVRFSERSELLFFIVLPVIFIFMLGDIGGGGDSRIDVLLVDLDQSGFSEQLVAALKADDMLDVSLISLAQAEKDFSDQDAPAWLTIPDGYEATLLDGQRITLDLQVLPNSTTADAAERAIQSAVSAPNRSLIVAHNSLQQVEHYLGVDSSSVPFDRQAYLLTGLQDAEQLFSDAPARLVVTQPVRENQSDYDQGSQAVNGQLITWVFIPLVAISGLFAFERRNKTLERLVVSPTRKVTYLLGIVMGQLGAAFVQMLLLILFGLYVMKINWGNSPPALILLLTVFALAAAALGVMLGTFIKTEGQATNLSIMLGMVFALMGGCWWPIELFPPMIENLAHCLPTYWAMQGLSNLSTRGLGPESILLSVMVLTGFAIIFFVVGVARFRYE